MKLKTKIIARLGVVAGMYAMLTILFMPIAFGPIQVRIAEGLSVLPIFFLEAPWALFVGCIIANMFSAFGVLDVVVGSLTTLVAALLTRLIYKKTKNVYISLLPPVILNAIFVPLVFLLTGGSGVYYIEALLILLTQTLFVYGIGLPLYFGLNKLKKSNNLLF